MINQIKSHEEETDQEIDCIRRAEELWDPQYEKPEVNHSKEQRWKHYILHKLFDDKDITTRRDRLIAEILSRYSELT